MIAFIILTFTGLLTYLILKLNISCMFLVSKKSEDKSHIVKHFFPDYINALFAFYITVTIVLKANPLINYSMAVLYFLAQLIWRSDLKTLTKRNHNEEF